MSSSCALPKTPLPYRAAVAAAYTYLFYLAATAAYRIRTYALTSYGYVIHEFDPWFNYRATVYLEEHGWHAFFHWFDYKSWYPLGRPIGTTIFPGMQISSVAIYKALNIAAAALSNPKLALSLNDVCCLVPCWFGVSATLTLGLLTRECSGSWSAAAAASAIMAVVPAHIMRSVGGGYDNESVAITAICATFWLWCCALRAPSAPNDGEATRSSYVFGVLSGLAYVYMVAAWGGFVFVLNMIALHAGALILVGRYTSKLHRAYSLFYVIGTIGATRVPPVGYKAVRDVEQMAPLVLFLGMQLLEYAEVQRRKHKLSWLRVQMLRAKLALPAVFLIACAAVGLNSLGYFGPVSSRIRSLFVKHTRTGNPLVDSVAEHQPANEQAYQHYLHHIYTIAPVGFVLSLFTWKDANLFIVLYALVAYYFSRKMARLVILLGPVASSLGGVAIGFLADQLLVNAVEGLVFAATSFAARHAGRPAAAAPAATAAAAPAATAAAVAAPASADDKTAADKEAKVAAKRDTDALAQAKAHAIMLYSLLRTLFLAVYRHPLVLVLRVGAGLYALQQLYPLAVDFYDYSHQLAESFSQPQIMFKAKLYNGKEVMVDDYREAYFWLRDKTPEDSRVMAWWDYGYQITGIGERTSIADGNTWNHEHIATLGLILSANQERAHSIARHLADYVLVWAGGGGDDLAKSPHMARIGNSVYRDICPGDPTCSGFGFYQGGVPTPMMEECLLYRLTQYGREDIFVNQSLFEHVFTSKYQKVRIFKVKRVSLKSKKWVANVSNRLCDAPGSWYCPGQYPPALAPLIARRKRFAQLEDFNVEKSAEDDEYQRAYHEKMEGGAGARSKQAKELKKKLAVRYVGCYGSELDFGDERIYEGGPYGSSAEIGRMFAKEVGMKHFAIARNDEDGHIFAFPRVRAGAVKVPDDECAAPCYDSSRYVCGCADELCGSLEPVAGEEHLRRWAVYELTSGKKKGSAKRGKVEL